MDFKRKIYNNLLNWKETKQGSTALLIEGARRIGKTFIVKKFGENEYDSYILIDFSQKTNELEKIFLDNQLDLDMFFNQLQLYFKTQLVERKSLIVFDEIQLFPPARQMIKHLVEDGRYDYVETGSLLSLKTNIENILLPSEEESIKMYPFDFEEFLWALSYEKLSKQIKSHFENNQYIPEAVHNLALELYDKYLIIGGMPEAVKTYISTNSFIKVQQIQNEIVNQYLADMAKYANATTSVKIRASYNSIPVQLAKENAKFQYKIVQKGASATIFGESIEWLNLSNIILTCQKIQHAYIPINAYVDLSSFKLYMSDIGILTMKSNFPIQIILSPINHDNTFLGAITENYVAQSLKANNHNLFYWTSEAKAEVDFILQIDDKAIPIEVKKGKRNRSKSLSLFMKKYDSNYAIRISRKNFGFENNIKSIPLYAVFCI